MRHLRFIRPSDAAAEQAAQARWAPVFDSTAHCIIDAIRAQLDEEIDLRLECGKRWSAALVAQCRAATRQGHREAKRNARMLRNELRDIENRIAGLRAAYETAKRAGGQR